LNGILAYTLVEKKIKKIKFKFNKMNWVMNWHQKVFWRIIVDRLQGWLGRMDGWIDG
jgi:hypothetical protein